MLPLTFKTFDFLPNMHLHHHLVPFINQLPISKPNLINPCTTNNILLQTLLYEMNSTTLGSGGLLSEKVGSFGYGIGVSVGILFLIMTITLASYFCTRTQVPPSTSPIPIDNLDPNNNHDHNSTVIEVGLDEATLLTYPKLLYSKAKLVNNKDTTASCCSICLADYKGSDMLRLLPDCGHLFHLKCVDPWLRLHPTCPVCRTTPVPTPVTTPISTPLAEVAPLARLMIV